MIQKLRFDKLNLILSKLLYRLGKKIPYLSEYIGGFEGRKIVWVSWKKICETDNLGILDLRVFNVALLGNWIWRMGMDKDGL